MLQIEAGRVWEEACQHLHCSRYCAVISLVFNKIKRRFGGVYRSLARCVVVSSLQASVARGGLVQSSRPLLGRVDLSRRPLGQSTLKERPALSAAAGGQADDRARPGSRQAVGVRAKQVRDGTRLRSEPTDGLSEAEEAGRRRSERGKDGDGHERTDGGRRRGRRCMRSESGRAADLSAAADGGGRTRPLLPPRPTRHPIQRHCTHYERRERKDTESPIHRRCVALSPPPSATTFSAAAARLSRL